MHEAVDEGRLGRREDLVLGGVGLPVRNVVPDGAVEEPGVLQHHADLASQVAAAHRGDVDAVQRDATGSQLVEPHDEVDERGLASPGRTHDRNGVAGLGDQGKVLDQRLVRVVTERHVLELHPSAAHGVARGLNRIGRLVLDIEQIEDPLGGSDARLQKVGHRRHLGERLGELTRVLDERLHVAQAHRTGRDPQTTDHSHCDIAQVPDEHHRGHDDAGDELSLEAGLEKVVVLRREALLHFTLPTEDLDQLVSGERLLDVGVQRAGVGPLRDELLLRAFPDLLGHDDRQRHRHQRDEGEQR